jgi:endo-beta-N-acetylglucosaminidase D
MSPLISAIDRRRFLFLSTAVAATSLVPGGMTAAAAPTRRSPLYPLTGQADAWIAFKTYIPERDADARFFRSRVPRAPRIAPLARTQAHPELTAEVAGGTLVAAYLTLDGTDADLNRVRYQTGTSHWVHVERAWQYQDIVVGWNSTGLIPNPALVDAAHRNGAKCLGTLFQPDKRMFDGSDLSVPDVAARLVTLAQFFGFDGYFVNFEGHDDVDARGIHDLIEAMQVLAHDRGITDFHIQFYNGYTDIAAVWPGPPHADGRPRTKAEPRANSMMLDQGWSNYGLTHGCCSGPALSTLPSARIDQAFPGIASVYYGLQLYPGPGYLGLIAPSVVTPNGGPAHGSLQVYSADDGLRKMRTARLNTLHAKPGLSAAEQAEIATFTQPSTRRNAWYDLHRRFWSGQSANPAGDNAPTPAQSAIYGSADIHKIYTDYEAPSVRPTDQMRLPITYGVANFITERSAVASLPFVTRFNTGEGDRFWKNGDLLLDGGWFNLGSQDILPTWSWWTRPLRGKATAKTQLLAIDYDYGLAFDGGTSLKISGRLGPADATEVRLFKTDLPIAADTQMNLVFAADGANEGEMRIGLTFADTADSVDWVPVDEKSAQVLRGHWQSWTTRLSAFAGRTLVAISLGFAAKNRRARPYQINIGQMSLTAANKAIALESPVSFTVDAATIATDGQSAQLELSWTFDPRVHHYDLISVHADGSKRWLGRISSDAYFVDQLDRRSDEAITRVYLTPCANDGGSGPPAFFEFAWTA